MPSQHSPANVPVHVRLPRDLVEAARERAGTEGETMTDVVGRALRAYVTPPPPEGQR